MDGDDDDDDPPQAVEGGKNGGDKGGRKKKFENSVSLMELVSLNTQHTMSTKSIHNILLEFIFQIFAKIKLLSMSVQFHENPCNIKF